MDGTYSLYWPGTDETAVNWEAIPCAVAHRRLLLHINVRHLKRLVPSQNPKTPFKFKYKTLFLRWAMPAMETTRTSKTGLKYEKSSRWGKILVSK